MGQRDDLLLLVEGEAMIFRKKPSLAVVQEVLRSLKRTGLEDQRWFSKEEIPLDTLEEWLPLLEPFYLPCKAERYLHGDMTQARIITVLRHICKEHGIEFKSQERLVNGKKTTLYQLCFFNPNPIVSFD
jgi:hypothetical protein